MGSQRAEVVQTADQIERRTAAGSAADTVPPGRVGVLLVANLPDGPLVGGVEVGVDMIMRSDLRARHAMRLFNTARHRDPHRPLHQRLAYQTRRFAQLAWEVARTRPRLVHVKSSAGINFWQGVGYCAIARALRRRVLLQLHGGVFDTWYVQHGRAGRLAIRTSLRLPSEILVLSKYWREFVAGFQPGRPIRILPNGVRTDEVQLRSVAPSTDLRVVTVGALGVRKGHFEILEAAAQLRDQQIRFVFAGEDEFGGEGEALRARSKQLGVDSRVEFAGAVTGAAKWRLLAESDVFLLPSHGENMPNAVLEAMAAGLPVVCTRVGALREMVEDGAVFVPIGDAAAIGHALLRLKDAPDLRERMGGANRAAAESRFAFGVVAEALHQLYVECKR